MNLELYRFVIQNCMDHPFAENENQRSYYQYSPRDPIIVTRKEYELWKLVREMYSPFNPLVRDEARLADAMALCHERGLL